jgi:hypothetical protein
MDRAMIWNDKLSIAIAELADNTDAQLDALIGIHLEHEVCIFFMAVLMEVRRRANERGNDRLKDLMKAPPSSYLVKN